MVTKEIVFEFMNKHWLIFLAGVLIIIYIVYQVAKNYYNLPKKQSIKKPIEIKKPEVQPELHPLDAFKEQLGIEQHEGKDIVEIANAQMTELNQKLKEYFMNYNQKMKESVEKIESEEKEIYSKADELKKRRSILLNTKGKLVDNISRTNIKE